MQFKIVQCYPVILSWYIVYFIVASHSLENEALTKANKMTAADRKGVHLDLSSSSLLLNIL